MSNQEDKAKEHGWVPKEEWEGAGKPADDWVDAREFNYRGELMSRISSQTNELKQLRGATSQYDKKLKKLGEAVSMLSEQNKKLAQTRLKEEKEELLHYRAEAEVAGDAAKMAAIDADLEQLKETSKTLEETPTIEGQEEQPGGMTPEQGREFRAWVEQNPWYVTNQQAAQYATFVASTLDKEGKSFTDYLNEVAEAVGGVFKDIDIGEGEEDTPPPRKSRVLEPGANGGPSTRKRSANLEAQLSDTEREIGKTFVEDGLFKSLEDYAKHLMED